jgi:CRISPR-associated protein Cas1
VFVLNYDGTIISSIFPPAAIKSNLRVAQIQAANDSKKKSTIAKALIQAKIARSLQVLEWLAERYDIEKDLRLVKREAIALKRAKSPFQVRVVEGRVALRYWETIRKILPAYLDFQGRMTSSHQNNASDPVNAALNYGYGFLEGECRKAINSIGLEPSVGFLHDFSDYQTKQSLVYDLQEPFRWLVDMTVIEAFESKRLDLRDFYFTGDDYRYRFKAEAKQRLIDDLRGRFNSGATYEGRVMKWDTLIQEKASELAKCLSGRRRTVDFSEPTPIIERLDKMGVREAILSLTQVEAKKRGIGKSTLHYLRKKASANESFQVYSKVQSKLSGDQFS